MENNMRNAVKAFIVHGGKVLLIKRRPNDVHKPAAWDIPGGRLEIGEDPYAGLQREAKEEVNLEINPLLPLDIHYFTRDDGQQITLMIFYCQPLTFDIQLSEEHTEYQWKDLNDQIESFPDWLQPPVQNLRTYIKTKTLAKEV